MIVLKEIEKIYLTKNSPQVVALKNINLTFESKGMVFITGKSGCGKSTLLNILGALDSCTSGSMIIENKNINEFTEKELDNYRNSYVGFVFQEFHPEFCSFKTKKSPFIPVFIRDCGDFIFV